MKLHPILIAVLLAALCGGGALLFSTLLEPAPQPPPRADTPRIVSVMPPITETLYEIGAGEYLVGRSDWCRHPEVATSLPPCGSARTPNVEAIARLEPTLIIADDSVATAHEKLSGLARAEFVPWLTAEEMLAGTRRLGELTGREQQANQLADELAEVLLAPEPAEGPRVLLAMAHTPGRLQTITFMRRNSMHGRLLNAAGGRNAADFDVAGVPTMSIEKLLELDPEIIILLGVSGKLDDDTRSAILGDWAQLEPLRAVRQGRIGLLDGDVVVPAARRTFRLVEILRAEIVRLGR